LSFEVTGALFVILFLDTAANETGMKPELLPPQRAIWPVVSFLSIMTGVVHADKATPSAIVRQHREY